MSWWTYPFLHSLLNCYLFSWTWKLSRQKMCYSAMCLYSLSNDCFQVYSSTMNVSTVKLPTLIQRGGKNVLNHFLQQVVPNFWTRDYWAENCHIKSIFLKNDSLVQDTAPSIQVQLHIQRDCAALLWFVKILSSRSHTQSWEKLWFCSWKTDCIAKHYTSKKVKNPKCCCRGTKSLLMLLPERTT